MLQCIGFLFYREKHEICSLVLLSYNLDYKLVILYVNNGCQWNKKYLDLENTKTLLTYF